MSHFNGATRLHAWKPGNQRYELARQCILQWSHASSRVETARPLTSTSNELESAKARGCQSIASSLLLVLSQFKSTPLNSTSERFPAKRLSVDRSQAFTQSKSGVLD